MAYWLLAPALLISVAVIAYPILSALDLSFQDIRITELGADRKPWTLANYQVMFGSAEFWRTTWTTVKLVVIVTLGSLLIGMATALLVNQRFRGRKIARILVAMPWAVPTVMAAVTWWWMFDASFGIINWALVRLGILDSPVAWFSSPGLAFTAICVIMIWKVYPFMSVMLLAGMQSLSEDQYDAAKVDGAGAWGRFRYVTLPGLRSVLTIATILIILWAFREFPIIWVITGGGPIGATRTLAIATYEQGFKFYQIGGAAALGMVTLVISLVVSIIIVRRYAQED